MSIILPHKNLASNIRSYLRLYPIMAALMLLAVSFYGIMLLSPSARAVQISAQQQANKEANNIKQSNHNQPKALLKPIKIGVSALIEHPSLQAIADGVRDGLEEAGYELGKNLDFTFQTAQNRQATLIQIAHKYVGDKVDILVPLGTGAAQAAANATKTIPIVFAGVSDPIAAGLLQDPAHPDRNITGLSDLPDVKRQIALIKELLPQARNIGFLYNPSEPNSLIVLKLAKEAAQSQNLSIIEAPVLQTSQVRNGALSLIGKVDAIYIGTDNTVVSAIEPALMVAKQHKIPVITAETQSVRRGALASFGSNYYSMGKESAALILNIINGKAISSLPVSYAKATDLVLNNKTAKAINFTFPEEVWHRASDIVE